MNTFSPQWEDKFSDLISLNFCQPCKLHCLIKLRCLIQLVFQYLTQFVLQYFPQLLLRAASAPSLQWSSFDGSEAHRGGFNKSKLIGLGNWWTCRRDFSKRGIFIWNNEMAGSLYDDGDYFDLISLNLSENFLRSLCKQSRWWWWWLIFPLARLEQYGKGWVSFWTKKPPGADI